MFLDADQSWFDPQSDSIGEGGGGTHTTKNLHDNKTLGESSSDREMNVQA
jgi:hypothetical protein